MLSISYGPKAKMAMNTTTSKSEMSPSVRFNRCLFTLQSQETTAVNCAPWSPVARAKVTPKEQRLVGDLEPRGEVTHSAS